MDVFIKYRNHRNDLIFEGDDCRDAVFLVAVEDVQLEEDFSESSVLESRVVCFVEDENELQMQHVISRVYRAVKVTRSSRKARGTEASMGWEIWHILSIKEHFLTWIIVTMFSLKSEEG